MEIFLDIETIPGQSPWIADFVAEKIKPPATIKKAESIEKWYAESFADAKAEAMAKTSFDGGLCQIVCISCAIDDGEIKSFSAKSAEDEAEMLLDFYNFFQNFTEFGRRFIGHNITGFDLRVIRQRSIVLGIEPSSGIPFNARPWDLNPFDTMMQWDQKNMTSLDKLARILGISGKSEIDGSMVYPMWLEGKHEEIAAYCRDDVRITREVYKKMKIML
jgi:predicted PolB exonuclease-like 3'-5' exonuclease